MLAGLTLSMMMTCLLQYMEVERARPKLEPMVLATSTSSGPEAVATESAVETKESQYVNQTVKHTKHERTPHYLK